MGESATESGMFDCRYSVFTVVLLVGKGCNTGRTGLNTKCIEAVQVLHRCSIAEANLRRAADHLLFLL